MDIEKALFLPSPYILTPIATTSEPLKMVMVALYSKDDPDNPYWETRAGSVFLLYRRFVLTEFWRSGFDSKFIGESMPRQAKELRRMVKAEVQLWQSVLKLLERMQTLCFLEDHTAILLWRIISECGLVMASFRYVESGEIGATEFIKQLQSQNRILQGVGNPFTLAESPTTYRVIGQAIALADSNDQFRKEYYLKVVSDRMSFVTCLKEQNARSYSQKKMVRQGRKPAQK